MVEIARAFKAAGADMIDCSSGQVSPDQAPVYGRMYQTPFSDRIRNEAGILTIAVGAIFEADHVDSIVAAGRADLARLRVRIWPIRRGRCTRRPGWAIAMSRPKQYVSGKRQLETNSPAPHRTRAAAGKMIMGNALQGRHALVTGGGRGIGAAIARRLLADGASVTLLGREQAGLDATVHALQSCVTEGAALGAVSADITDADWVSGALPVPLKHAGRSRCWSTTPVRRTARRSARPISRSGSGCSRST
jgi:anthraniloyl-CoA monooxygenase